MNFCRAIGVLFIHPEHALADRLRRHPGEAPRAAASFNHAVEQTTSQPTGLVGDGGVRGGWLAVAHFLRSPESGCSHPWEASGTLFP